MPKRTEKRRAYEAAYREANRERLKAYQKTYQAENAERVSAVNKAYREANKEQVRETRKAWRAKPETAEMCRWHHIKHRYGLTKEGFVALREAQNGLCRLCPSPLPERGPHVHIDHCHSSGRVRGLLCRRCNTRLGFLEKAGVAQLFKDFEYLGWA